MLLRYDDMDTTLLCQNGVLIPNEWEHGSASADFYSFHPEQSITASKGGKTLKQAVAKNAEETARPAYLIRVLEAEQVLDYELHISVCNTDTKQPPTPNEIAASVAETAADLLEKYPGKKLDILPASRFFVPAPNYEKRQKYFSGLNRHFINDGENGDPEYCCRQALIKCGGDNDQYCNQVNIIEPSKPGADPVLIGGYRYAADKINQEPEQQAARCRP